MSHFRNDGLTAGVIVLVVWILIAAAALYWRDARGTRTQAVA
ncbi:hypothetical protein [Streptomyces sp. NPDC006739]